MHERKYFVIKYDHYDSYVAFFFFIKYKCFYLLVIFGLYKIIIIFYIVSYGLSKKILKKNIGRGSYVTSYFNLIPFIIIFILNEIYKWLLKTRSPLEYSSSSRIR
jgi:hypothetical protein